MVLSILKFTYLAQLKIIQNLSFYKYLKDILKILF
jgi:hypothetical protein